MRLGMKTAKRAVGLLTGKFEKVEPKFRGWKATSGLAEERLEGLPLTG